MKEIASIIVIYAIIKLTSYGVWNVKQDKNMLGAVGTAILDAALIFYLATLVMRVFG